jgi:hypothetical protein
MHLRLDGGPLQACLGFLIHAMNRLHFTFGASILSQLVTSSADSARPRP